MTTQNKRGRNGAGGGNPGNLTGEGSGQQTAGKRANKMRIQGKENYQQDGQKPRKGSRGGNRS